MIRRVAAAAAALAVMTAAVASAACPPGHAALARGINVPGVDGAGYWKRAAGDVLATLRDRGLTHVRLPVKAENLTSRLTDAATIAATVSDVAAALDGHLARGFSVIVDLHGGGPFGELTASDPQAAAAAVAEAWTRLAPAINAAPAGRVYAEMLNEPRVEGAVWRGLSDRLLPVLRGLMPTVPIVLSTGGAQRWDALLGETPPADGRILYAVHYYDPMAFTHQGAAFLDGPIGRLGSVPFPLDGADPRVLAIAAERRKAGDGEAADYVAGARDFRFGPADIAAAMAALGDWSRRTGVPVIVDEFGVLQDRAPPADRIAWLTTVAREAEAACLGWTHWELEQGFGLLRRDGTLDPAALDALLPR